MNKNDTRRFLTFVGIHFFPVIVLWMMQIASMTSGYVSPSSIWFMFGCPFFMAVAMIPAYKVWARYRSWWLRLFAIDFSWCLLLLPFLWFAGSMGLGLSWAEQGKTPSRGEMGITMAAGMIYLLFIAQFFVIPWTFLSMWFMRIADRKSGEAS